MFVPYKGPSLELKKALKQKGIKANLMDEVKRTMSMWIKVNSVGGAITQETLALTHEIVHYGLSHHVYYVPKEMSDKLQETQMKVTLSQLRIPHSVFEVSCEQDSGLPGVLVCIMPGEAVRASLFKVIKEGCELANVPLDTEFTYEDSVTIRFQSTVDGGLVHAVMRAKDFENKTVDEAVKNLGPFRHVTGLALPAPLDDTDMEVQRKLLRVVFGLLAYHSVPDADIVAHRDRNRPTMGAVKTNGFIVGNNIRKQTWFIRSGCPVVLSHERYKRDDEGKVRVIWRRAAEVNKHAKAADPEAKRKVHEVVED